jgi:hypothetical protein
MIYWLCDKCERTIAKHIVWVAAARRHLCCGCYVGEGNAPADWHKGCMVAYQNKTKQEEFT